MGNGGGEKFPRKRSWGFSRGEIRRGNEYGELFSTGNSPLSSLFILATEYKTQRYTCIMLVRFIQYMFEANITIV